MAKRIIILERVNQTNWRALFWLAVPSARQVFHANADAVSAYKQATTEETTALKNGSVAERVETVSVPQGATLPQITAALEARWQVMQDEVTNENTYARYGSFWDGTAWTQAGA